MHSFTNLIIILLININFRKQEFTVVQNVFHERSKICMFDIYKIIVQCEKSNNKYPCEFVLTWVIRVLYIIALRLRNLEY